MHELNSGTDYLKLDTPTELRVIHYAVDSILTLPPATLSITNSRERTVLHLAPSHAC